MGRVLITGASMGIGFEMAKVFSREGTDLVLVSRDEKALREIAEELERQGGIEVKIIAKDLSLKHAAEEIFRELEEEGIEVDELINNAGFGALGAIVNLENQLQLDMIEVNVSAVTELTRLFLPGMLQRGRGGVLNVGSVAGFQPGPNMAVYFATKAYVLSFTEALAEEVKGSGVRVTCLAPGPTRTGFGERSGMGKIRIFEMWMMSADEVARAGVEGFRRGDVIIIPSITNKIGTFLIRLLPRFVVRRLVYWLQARRRIDGVGEGD